MSRSDSQIFDASLLAASAKDRHFTADELSRGLADGFAAADRWRAILHFGRMRCGVCWGLVGALAARVPPVPAVASDSFEPMAAAVRRLVAAYNDPVTLDRLRPAHRFWVGNCRLEELGFGRLMLEESRQHALGQPAQGVAVARMMHDLLERSPSAELGKRSVDLRGLARAYLGDELRAAGSHELAAQQLAMARKVLGLGTGDPELRATWYELESDLAQAAGQYTLALGLLDKALELLHPIGMEGRRAETFVRQGLARLRCGEDLGAAEAFRQALSEMPPGNSPRLRLETLQYLALAELRSRRFAEAREHLAAARTLEALTTPLLQAQRLWIEGLLDLETQRYGAAEEPLRASLQRFLMLGRTADAAQVLASLGHLYALAGRVREFEGLELEFHPLLEAPATRDWVLAQRQKVVRWAEDVGVALPSISQRIAELESEPKKWIH